MKPPSKVHGGMAITPKENCKTKLNKKYKYKLKTTKSKDLCRLSDQKG